MSLSLDQHESRVRRVEKWAAAARASIALCALQRLGDGAARVAVAGMTGTLWGQRVTGAADSFIWLDHPWWRTVVQFECVASYVLTGVAMIAFLRWLVLLLRAARGLGANVPWSPARAVFWFFVPLANFVQPVRVMRSIASLLAPDRLPEPPVRMVADGSAGYREARVVPPPVAATLPPALIGLWWITYWIAPFLISVARIVCAFNPTIFGSISTITVNEVFGQCLSLVAAFCAMRMVRALTLLLGERLRRVRHNPEEVLREVGLVLE